MNKIFKITFFLFVTIPLAVIMINQFLYYTGYADNASTADNQAPLKFYAINLDRQPEKFAKLKAQTDHFGIELIRFSAIDGYQISLIDQETKEKFHGSDIKQNPHIIKRDHKYAIYCNNTDTPEFIYEAFKFKNFHHKPLTAGELGIICSSRLLWKQIAQTPQLAIIFEDDAVLFPDFDQNLRNIIASLPPKWDITYLDGDITYNDVNKRRPRSWSNIFRFPQIILHDIIIKIPTATDIWGAYGYLINTESAAKLLNIQIYRNAMPLDNVFADSIKDRDLIGYLSRRKIMSYDRALPSDIIDMGRK